ncbi:phosphohistidine phosphatase SixA [Pelagicoccus sp. SDUM812002]|uniref:phosphohistidine phosphatase SixA n=1 Tax=Pelagicoccus sp. SDUM812002 TaxID=3041266 RepID=UPI00280E6073|nr:phosphohistidine phosphatase SixA [Pelagicoccus sp. SDUM812002]MDQ8184905.1 phosphohistidine phosphatase SixA [Pelagicoccus sp. SDUM812002]
MLQHLHLVRHAHAESDAPTDALRPLSPKGHRQCSRLVEAFSKNQMIQASTIWHSGLVRAFETAEALANGLKLGTHLVQKDGLAPYDDPTTIAAEMNALDQSCLVAGHEPNLSYLASLLLAGHDSFQRVVFPKASILCLSRMKAGTQATPWQIVWHLSHKHFK